MGKKYIAMVMDRHYVGEDSFIFSANHAVIGEVDLETRNFIDRNGNEYFPMLGKELLTSQVPYAYSNIIPLSDLQQTLGGEIGLKDAIKEFENRCKKILFFVGKGENDTLFYVTLNVQNIKDSVNNVGSRVRQEEELSEEDDEEDMKDDMKELIKNIVNGKYSLKELIKMRDNLKRSAEDLTEALDVLDLQIEATEQGKSFMTLPREKEEVEEIKKEQGFIPPVDINDLFKKVTKTLIAQDEPARRVIVEIARKEMDARKKKEGLLLTGPTGVGKTELMRLIAKYLNKPFIKVDSTQLTIPGYVGRDIEEVLWELYENCNKDLEKAENAIIFFDEIDKKGSSKKSDVSGQGVINVLLPFIEGCTYTASPDSKPASPKVKINTEKMTVIFGGAYTDVYKNLLEKNGIGFGGEVSTKPKYRKATTQDFVEHGMMTDEFMSRVTVVKLNDLDVQDIQRIMLESDESAIKVQEGIFKQLGVKLTCAPSFTSSIAEKAYKAKTGARGIKSVVDNSTWMAFEEIYMNPGRYEEVIMDQETVEDPSHYQLIKKRDN